MAMLTLPLDLAVEILQTVLSEDSKAWQGQDETTRWVIARGKDEDTDLDIFIIVNEPLIYTSKTKD